MSGDIGIDLVSFTSNENENDKGTRFLLVEKASGIEGMEADGILGLGPNIIETEKGVGELFINSLV